MKYLNIINDFFKNTELHVESEDFDSLYSQFKNLQIIINKK